ncbi:MAG: hypothetical protein M3136_00250 [Thermoproteota archaeon]|nr:hypothetical protein [Thermoproteota archaeon]
MNNRNEVVQQIMEWSNMEALAHTLKKNNSVIIIRLILLIQPLLKIKTLFYHHQQSKQKKKMQGKKAIQQDLKKYLVKRLMIPLQLTGLVILHTVARV